MSLSQNDYVKASDGGDLQFVASIVSVLECYGFHFSLPDQEWLQEAVLNALQMKNIRLPSRAEKY